MSKRWQYNTNKNYAEVLKIEQSLKVNRLISQIMVNRGIYENDARIFLKPTRYDFHNPFEMKDLEKAINRIMHAIDKKEKTIIYGDYDVDGITSTTVLKCFLEERGLHTDYYIPNRLNEGYGLNKLAIEKIAKDGYSLIITVDCGITAIEEVKLAKGLGIDTIITDHHEPAEELPNDAIAIIDCKRKDNKYPFRELCGAGVAFKIIQAISQKMNLDEKEYLKFLDIVCIGTISDIVPLKDENRVITKLGLKLINCTKNIGLQALINSIGYKIIDSASVAFGLAPRINACGRMGDADTAIKLFLSKNIEEANILVNKMQDYNLKRQSEELKIYEDALKQIEENNFDKEDAIILAGKNWHTGVIGIVSSKITEKYYRPSILIGYKENEEIGKGSRKKYTRI